MILQRKILIENRKYNQTCFDSLFINVRSFAWQQIAPAVSEYVSLMKSLKYKIHINTVPPDDFL